MSVLTLSNKTDALPVILWVTNPTRREAPTSIALDAVGAHSENPQELLDVPHILRKLKMRRYEALASDSELNLRAFLRCLLRYYY